MVVLSSRASFKACFVALMLTMGLPVSTYYTSVCFGKIRSRMLGLTKLNLYCFGLVSIPSLLSALRVVLWLCDEDASSFVDFFCTHPPLLLLLLRHEAFV